MGRPGDSPSPACWGRWRVAPDGVWPAASALSRIARPAARTRIDPDLLSAPHPPLRGTFPASRRRGDRRLPAGPMTYVNVIRSTPWGRHDVVALGLRLTRTTGRCRWARERFQRFGRQIVQLPIAGMLALAMTQLDAKVLPVSDPDASRVMMKAHQAIMLGASSGENRAGRYRLHNCCRR
jgi:hypothetical protein